MGTELGELSEYFSPGLTLTVLGREYVVPLPSAELGLWCRMLAQATGEIHAASTPEEIEAALRRVQDLPELPGTKDQTFAQRMLREAYEQMLAGKVPDPYIEFCARTAYIWLIADEETAERYWKSGGNPEALRPAMNRAERRAAARTGGSRTDAATETRPRASTNGTNSQRRSPRRETRNGSPGRTS
jgi:hypothetical protein